MLVNGACQVKGEWCASGVRGGDGDGGGGGGAGGAGGGGGC